jgi:hypothetical protein
VTDLALESLVIGDTWLQPFQWVDSDGDGIDISAVVLRATIRSSPGVDPALAFLSSYPDGGLTIDPDQVTNAGQFAALLEPYQTETLPVATRVCGDVEMTGKGPVVAVSGTADVVADSAVIDVGTANAALLRPGFLIEVDGVLLAVVTVDATLGTVVTDYVWPATDSAVTLSAWRGVRQTRTWSMQTTMPSTED